MPSESSASETSLVRQPSNSARTSDPTFVVTASLVLLVFVPLSPRERGQGVRSYLPVIPDIAIPLMKYRWPMKNTTITGTVSHMLAAIVMCQDAS